MTHAATFAVEITPSPPVLSPVILRVVLAVVIEDQEDAPMPKSLQRQIAGTVDALRRSARSGVGRMYTEGKVGAVEAQYRAFVCCAVQTVSSARGSLCTVYWCVIVYSSVLVYRRKSSLQ